MRVDNPSWVPERLRAGELGSLAPDRVSSEVVIFNRFFSSLILNTSMRSASSSPPTFSLSLLFRRCLFLNSFVNSLFLALARACSFLRSAIRLRSVGAAVVSTTEGISLGGSPLLPLPPLAEADCSSGTAVESRSLSEAATLGITTKQKLLTFEPPTYLRTVVDQTMGLQQVSPLAEVALA